MNPKLPRGTLDRLWADLKNWKGGIYSCKDDPRVVVPKRVRWAGWTVNFAHSRTWLFLLGIIGVFASPMVWFSGVGAEATPTWFIQVYFGSLAVFAVTVIVISPILSSPKRYEE
jgi:hypothetical protein